MQDFVAHRVYLSRKGNRILKSKGLRIKYFYLQCILNYAFFDEITAFYELEVDNAFTLSLNMLSSSLYMFELENINANRNSSIVEQMNMFYQVVE